MGQLGGGKACEGTRVRQAHGDHRVDAGSSIVDNRKAIGMDAR